MIEYLDIGKIVNTHGIKGELKIMPLTDDPRRYDLLKTALVEKNGSLQDYKVESVKYFKNLVLLKLKGIDTIEDAEKMKNLILKIHRKDAVKLPEGSYFVCDLIGCEVKDINGVFLGKLEDILQTGSNDVYVVREKEEEILIPALKTVLKNIDIEQKSIIVDLPKGLIDNEV